MNGDKAEAKIPTAKSPFATPPPVNTPVTTTPVTTSPVTNTTTTTLPSTPATQQVTTIVPEKTPAAALNPEHGKPGHRCDIAVGAPLDSKPTLTTHPATTATTSKAAPVVSAPVITTTAAATTTATNSAGGLNPEHGKPGHRCDIAVGAPLNSTPVKTTETQPTAIQPSIAPAAVTPTISPVAPTQPSVTTTPTINEKGEQLNPEHGKPGHRCDIAVGAPLNSKPKQ
jgi:hypothetical protein